MKKREEKNAYDLESYERTQMQKEMIVQKLRDRGSRVTRQRLILLDIILEEECSCCKEIYYKAVRKDKKIGLATVYRLVRILEEIGAISRKNMYKIVCGGEREQKDVYVVEFDDGTVARLSAKKWYQIVRIGLKECGYMQNRELHNVRVAALDKQNNNY